MKYRHSFHAGNFADVHKHIALLALIAALQRKDKGFLYLETHAGRGLYELDSAQANHGTEARHGIGLVEKAAPAAPEIVEYLAAVQALRQSAGGANLYPGSPLLAARALRLQDRGVAAEIQAPECRALHRRPEAARVQPATRRAPRAGADRSAVRTDALGLRRVARRRGNNLA
jgi:23S rRNA (adenine2030-N6)-methyltransferase